MATLIYGWMKGSPGFLISFQNIKYPLPNIIIKSKSKENTNNVDFIIKYHGVQKDSNHRLSHLINKYIDFVKNKV